jgi:phosphoglycolate phosphatase-like HAD superfamily hydrolase
VLNIFQNYKVVLFDLDDTLYQEIEYLKAAFHAIGQFFEKEYALNALQIEDFLITIFTKQGRKNLFNQCFKHFELEINAKKRKSTDLFRDHRKGALVENIFVEQCLNILRTVELREKIRFYPFVYEVIPKLLKQGKQIFIITNGNVLQQENKLKHLEWNGMDVSITVVFANQFAPKPSPKVFTDFLEPNFNLKNKSILFVGNAETDAEFSSNIGVDFLHVDYFK